jgi:hypothetical protein
VPIHPSSTYHIIGAVLVLLVLLPSCTPGYGLASPPDYRLWVQDDDFTDSSIFRMEGNRLPAPPSQGLLDLSVPYMTELNAQRFYQPESGDTYSLIFRLQGNGWLFIRRGESLRILADDERIVLSSADGSVRNRDILSGRMIREQAWYRVTAEQIETIARAGHVRLRLDGERGYIERELGEANQSNLMRFLVEQGPQRRSGAGGGGEEHS